MSPAMSAFALSSIMMFTLCNSEPVPMEHLTLHGVETFVNWSNEQDDQEVMTVMLLFHGCNNQGYDWFRKPEEISFLREALSHTISLVAFTTPRHRGNFCWPSEGSEFEEVRDLIGKALLELLQLKAKSASIASSASSSLILVGASSGGNFASRLPAAWSKLQMIKVAAFLSVVSPTSFVRKAELVEEPGPDFPPTGLVYMPKDKTFASEEAVATLLQSLHGAGVAAKAWPVAPRPVTPRDLSARLKLAGISVKEESANEFMEALVDMELVKDGEVMEDPRRVPWHRAVGLLDKDTPLRGEHRQHRLRCVEEILNRAWAQHEFGSDAEVLQWLLSHAHGQVGVRTHHEL